MLFLLVAGLSLGCLMVDVMHAVDLGVTAHIVGNIFAFCVRKHVFGGSTIEENAALLDRELVKWPNAKKVSAKWQGELKWERIKTKSGWSKLNGEGGGDPRACRLRIRPRQLLLPS